MKVIHIADYSFPRMVMRLYSQPLFENWIIPERILVRLIPNRRHGSHRIRPRRRSCHRSIRILRIGPFVPFIPTILYTRTRSLGVSPVHDVWIRELPLTLGRRMVRMVRAVGRSEVTESIRSGLSSWDLLDGRRGERRRVI